MESFLQRLRRGPVVVGDGAWGTQLMERGLEPGRSPEEFNLSRPEALSEIAGLYVEAGAEILTTNTFGASPIRLRSLADRTEEINRRAVEAVRPVARGRAWVAGSIGPTGALLKPYGDAGEGDVEAAFRRQARALFEAGVDLFCVETMTDLREAVLAVRAAKEIASGVPVLATMTFDATPRGWFTVMGVAVRQAAVGLEAVGADAVGSNCGIGIDPMIEIAREFRSCSALPVVIQPNAGLPEARDGRVVYPETPEFMADRVDALVDAGVTVIGGCCGTTPEHIRVVGKRIRGRYPPGYGVES